MNILNLFKDILFGFSLLLLSSCVTVQYHDPIPLSQSQIKELAGGIITATGERASMGSKKIKSCLSQQEEELNQCGMTICKENQNTETGYECQLYVSKAYSLEEKTMQLKKYENAKVQTVVDAAVKEYNGGKKKSLVELCNKDNVTCYVNNKYYPSDKKISEKSYSTTTFAQSYVLRDRLNLEVTVYESTLK